MGTIGSIVVQLEAESAQFEKGTKDAGHALDELKDKAEGLHLKDYLAEGLSIGAGIEMVHLAAEAVEKLVEVGREAVAKVEETVQGATRAFRLAGTLHIPTDTLMAYQNAARAVGIETDSFNSNLKRLEKNLGQIATGGGKEADETLARLGLSGKALANQSIDKTFEQIADKISGIKNPTEQAADAAALFGAKTGQEMLPMLQQGAAGLEKFKQEGREFGNTLTDIDAAKLVAVNNQFLELKERLEGVQTRIVVGVAPALLALGDELVKLVPSADEMKEHIQNGLHDIAVGIGYVLDAWQLYKTYVLSVETAVGLFVTESLKQLDLFAHGLEKLINMLPGVHVSLTQTLDAITEKAQEMTKSLADQTREEWNKPWPHQAVDDAFNHITSASDKAAADIAATKNNIASPIDESFTKTAEKVEHTLAELKKQVDEFGMNAGQKKLFDLKGEGAGDEQLAQAQRYIDTLQQLENTKKATEEVGKLTEAIDTFGMSAGQKKIHDLEGLTGVDPTIIEQAKSLQQQMDAMEKHKKLAEEAASVHESVEAPLEKHNEQLAKLNEQLDAGVLSQEDYARAVAKANKELESQNDHKEKGHAHDKVAATVRRFDFNVPIAAKSDPQRELAQNAKQQLEEQKKQTFYLAEQYRFQKDNHYGNGPTQNDIAQF